MKLTREQRANARKNLATALEKRRTAASHQKPVEKTIIEWDNAIARLKDMLDEIDRKR